MKNKRLNTLLAFMAFGLMSLFTGCSEDIPECEQYDTRDACSDAGCAFLQTIKVDFDEDGQCIIDEAKEREFICVYREIGIDQQLETMYFRDSKPQTDIRWFSSDHGPIEGWTRCREAGRGELCGCESAASEP